MDFLAKYNDQPFVTTVSNADCQNWAVVTFISPVDQSLKSSMKTVNDIYHNEGNKLLADMATIIYNKVVSDITKRADDEIARYRSLKYNRDNRMIDNVISMLKYLKIKDGEFNAPQRPFTDNVDDLEYKFNNYIVANVKNLDSNYEKLHGKETNKRGVKITGVFSSKGKAETFASKMPKEPTSKWVVPVGKWIPWRSYDINSSHYSITDEMCDELYELLLDNDREFDQRARDFYARKDQLKKGKITI